ncbi:hypothetical protein EVAR_19803_1 [Eumeta japonica]|uniref:Uncharacterized protein n=1 Tax=Eumeta variegata TaxID=151549 RepID=A0A4C1UQP3_EUMVA|nr:hypothetical protein EVAR_19803_1 [Eumeta japonica]
MSVSDYAKRIEARGVGVAVCVCADFVRPIDSCSGFRPADLLNLPHRETLAVSQLKTGRGAESRTETDTGIDNDTGIKIEHRIDLVFSFDPGPKIKS